MATKAPKKEFTGAIWEPYNNVSANREAEMALVHLALVFTQEEFDVTPFERRDFHYSDTGFLFMELKAMTVAGKPREDQAARTAWFERPELARKMTEACEGWVEKGTHRPWAHVFELCQRGSFASLAHVDHYFNQVRTWRVTRGEMSFAYDLHQKAGKHPDKPLEVLDWAQRQIDGLRKLADSIRLQPAGGGDETKLITQGQ